MVGEHNGGQPWQWVTMVVNMVTSVNATLYDNSYNCTDG